MADTNLQVQEPPKEKKKRKSNVKKSDLPPKENGTESRKSSTVPTDPTSPPVEPTPTPAPLEATPAPPPAAPTSDSGSRKESLAPPEIQEGYREYAQPASPKSQSIKRTEQETVERQNSTPKSQTTIRRQSEMPRKGSKRVANIFEDLDQEKLLELKEAFKLFDLDRDGYIDYIDLKLTYGTLGKTDIPDEQIKHMLSEASNPLDFEAFVMLLGFKTVALDPEEILLAALAKWDITNSGFISEDRIKHDLMTWGDKFTSDEVDVALEDAPMYVTSGSHMIDYVKFCKLLCGLRKKTKEVTVEDFMS